MNSKKVFLLDDDEYAELLMGTIFRGIDLIKSFVIYDNGWNALEYLKTCDPEKFPEILFVDLNMPEMDGFEFIVKYEQEFLAKYPNSKIVVLTNSILEKDRRKSSLHKSVFDYVNKPLTTDNVVKIINNYNFFSSLV